VKAVPDISVVMAVHNRARYVARAVDSILGQTFRNLELIAVDDGSTDASPQILADYAARDSRVRLHRQRHGGVSAARNAGIALARGEFVAVMDDDDIALPARLEKQVVFLRENPDFASVSVRCETMDEDDSFIKVTKVRKERQEAGLPLSVLAREAVAVNQSTMLRRSALVAVGGYRSFFTVGEDYDLALRLAEKFGVACINETLHRHRQYAPRGGVNLMSSHALAPFYCAAVFSSHCRRHGAADPVGEGVTAWALAPAAAAALPAEIKEICIKNAATDARKLLQRPAPGELERLLQFMDALSAGREEQRARTRTLCKILFYAVRRGRWWDAGRVLHELAFPLRPPEVA